MTGKNTFIIGFIGFIAVFISWVFLTALRFDETFLNALQDNEIHNNDDVLRIEIDAVEGLQFSPVRFAVAPGHSVSSR